MSISFDDVLIRPWQVVDATMAGVVTLSVPCSGSSSELLAAQARLSKFRGTEEEATKKIETAVAMKGRVNLKEHNTVWSQNAYWHVFIFSIEYKNKLLWSVNVMRLHNFCLVEIDAKLKNLEEVGIFKCYLNSLLDGLHLDENDVGVLPIELDGMRVEIPVPDGMNFHDTCSNAQVVLIDNGVYLSIKFENADKPLKEEIEQQIRRASLCNSDMARLIKSDIDFSGYAEEYIQYQIVRLGKEYGSCTFVRDRIGASLVLTAYLYKQNESIEVEHMLKLINFKELRRNVKKVG